MRYFEDFEVGQVFHSGMITVDREEIVSFARKFDPQGFHTGDEAPIPSLFPDVIASGWHISAVCMRLFVDTVLKDSSCLCSPGIRTLEWPAPILPGDTLSAVIRVKETRSSESRGDRGIVVFEIVMENQHQAVVAKMVPIVFFANRRYGNSQV